MIYQGFKIYGIHLGAKVRTPARESDPPHMPPNIYLAQEAQLKQRAQKSRWDYVALRPDVVVGDVYGNPMNIALVIGVFAELSRELGDSDALSRHRQSLWPACSVHGCRSAGAGERLGRDQQTRPPAKPSMSPTATSSAGSGCGRTWHGHLGLEIADAGAPDARPPHGR